MSISVRQLRGRDEILGHAEAIADAATRLRGKTSALVGISFFIPIVVMGASRAADALNGGDGLITSWGEVASELAIMLLMWNPATTLTHAGLIGSPQRHYEQVCQRMAANRLDWDNVGRNFHIKAAIATDSGGGGPTMLDLYDQVIYAPLGPTLRWIFQKLHMTDVAWLGIDRLLRLDPETREPVMTVVVRTAPQSPKYPVTQRARLGERLRSMARQPLRIAAN